MKMQTKLNDEQKAELKELREAYANRAEIFHFETMGVCFTVIRNPGSSRGAHVAWSIQSPSEKKYRRKIEQWSQWQKKWCIKGKVNLYWLVVSTENEIDWN